MAGMIDCPYCGKLTDPKLENCPHCGGSIEGRAPRQRAPQPVARSGHTCPNCNATVADGAIICVTCGTNLLTGQKIAEEAERGVAQARRSILLWAVPAGLVLLVAVVGVLIVLLSGNPVEEALELCRQGNHLGAIEVLTKHLDENPNDGEALFVLGKAYWKTNRFSNAADAFEKVAELGNVDPRAELMAVVSLSSVVGQNTVARQASLLQAAATREPDNARVAYLQAMASGAQGNFKEQAAALDRLLAKWPDHPTAQRDLGVALALEGSYAAAAKALSGGNSSGTDPGDLAALRGFVAYLSGDAAAAETELAAALEAGTSMRKEVLTRLGVLLVTAGRLAEASTYLQEAVEMDDPSRTAQFFYAASIVDRGGGSEALRYFSSLGEKRGTYAVESNVQAADLLLEQGDVAKAREAVERAASLGGTGAPLETLRGRLAAQEGRVREAQNAFRRAIDADPSYAPAHLENGLAFLGREVFTEALQEFEAYLRIVAGGGPDTRSAEVQVLVDQLRQTVGAPAPETVAKAAGSEGRTS